MGRERGRLGNRVRNRGVQMSGDGRTVAHPIQGHFRDDIVDVAHAQQTNGEPARCIPLCTTGKDTSVSEMIGEERGGCIELGGGVLCILEYG